MKLEIMHVLDKAKEKISTGLEKLNAQPQLTSQDADDYNDLSQALLNIVTACVMMEEKDYGYSGARIHAPMNVPGVSNSYPRVSYDGRRGMDGDGDGIYNESRGRMTPDRYYYSGHSGKEHAVEQLKAMEADADSERERRFFKDMREEYMEMKK